MTTNTLEEAKKILDLELNYKINKHLKLNQPSQLEEINKLSQTMALIEINEYLNTILYVLQNRLNQ